MNDVRERLEECVEGFEPDWHTADDVRKRANARRTRSRISAGAVAAVIAIATTGFLVSGFIGGEPATGGRKLIRVDGLEALHHHEAVEGQLRAEGVDASIVAVPLRDEGLWWWVTVDRPEELTVQEFEALRAQLGSGGVHFDPQNTSVLELPKMPGHITLFVGEGTPKDQFSVSRYDRFNELSPLGTFYCLGIDPNDPSALGDAIEARGYEIKWTLESGNHGHEVASPPSGTSATWAWLSAPGYVDMRISPAGREAEEQQRAAGTYAGGLQPPWARPC
jgi:hypothetical protein